MYAVPKLYIGPTRRAPGRTFRVLRHWLPLEIARLSLLISKPSSKLRPRMLTITDQR